MKRFFISSYSACSFDSNFQCGVRIGVVVVIVKVEGGNMKDFAGCDVGSRGKVAIAADMTRGQGCVLLFGHRQQEITQIAPFSIVLDIHKHNKHRLNIPFCKRLKFCKKCYKEGLIQWRTKLVLHLQRWHPMWTLVGVPVDPPSSQPPTILCLGRQQSMVQVVGTL